MVSKTKLKSELQDFNDDLDKYMKKVDFDGLTTSTTNMEYSKSLESREHAILFSENLKEIRYEINMMRKNMTSDVGVMVAKEVDKLKSGFFNELMNSQNQVFDHIRSIDLSPLKELQEEMTSIKEHQRNLDASISDLKEELHKQMISTNTHQEKRTSAILDEFKHSQSALLKKIYSFDSAFKTLEKQISASGSYLEQNSPKALEHSSQEVTESSTTPKKSVSSTPSKEFEQKIEVLHKQSEDQLHNFEEEMHKTKSYLEKTPHLSSQTGEISFEQQSHLPSRDEFSVDSYNSKPAQRILSIDEKLKRLNELR